MVHKDLVKPSTLAIMNGHPVTEQPRPGERLKIVVAGRVMTQRGQRRPSFDRLAAHPGRGERVAITC